jgi:hypothetical protein
VLADQATYVRHVDRPDTTTRLRVRQARDALTRALFLNAVLFVTAQEQGLTLVSGNLSDMDLLLRVGGAANVVLYVV